MKPATSKNPPVRLRSYGIVGNPAPPTTAPIGRLAASLSVAGTSVEAALVAPVEDAGADADALELEGPVAGGGVAGVVPVLGVVAVGAGVAAAGGVAGAAAVAPSPPDPALSLIARNCMLLLPAIEFSWTSIEAVSDCSGTALPRTTRRP